MRDGVAFTVMALPDFEKLGAFYLGKVVRSPHGASCGDDLLLYDAKDLTTHAVCVGMTGSGKTGLCLSLLEEAAIDGIPAIAIDPKGDLGQPAADLPRAAPRTTSGRGSTKARRRARA